MTSARGRVLVSFGRSDSSVRLSDRSKGVSRVAVCPVSPLTTNYLLSPRAGVVVHIFARTHGRAGSGSDEPEVSLGRPDQTRIVRPARPDVSLVPRPIARSGRARALPLRDSCEKERCEVELARFPRIRGVRARVRYPQCPSDDRSTPDQKVCCAADEVPLAAPAAGTHLWGTQRRAAAGRVERAGDPRVYT